MKLFLSICAFALISNQFSISQVVEKPRGCFVGTNGTNPAALANVEGNGVLLTEQWSTIEVTPGVYDFSSLHSKIDLAKAQNKKYCLAIAAGAFGSPSWLIDSLDADFFSFIYAGDSWKLPLWWDTVVQNRLELLIEEFGEEFMEDTSLSHVYVSQMTTNGIEGHLNGVNMIDFGLAGYTDTKWINSAKTTTNAFADAFPDIPIVFEIHEIDHDTLVPATIINDLYAASDYCKRIGLGMWWISGKYSYQEDLITFIGNFSGDKYAQIIGRSDQTYRFQDSSYATVFTQAKELGIRYIEPWPYEFQHHTYDSLLNDFNTWATLNFSASDSCYFLNANSTSIYQDQGFNIYPNPFVDQLTISSDKIISSLQIYTMNGALISSKNVSDYSIQILRNELNWGEAFFITLVFENGETVSRKVVSLH